MRQSWQRGKGTAGASAACKRLRLPEEEEQSRLGAGSTPGEEAVAWGGQWARAAAGGCCWPPRRGAP